MALKNKYLYPATIFLCVLQVSLLNSCKINYSLNGASIPPEAKTVSVAYFNNQASLAPPAYSQQFSEALRNQMASQTNLALAKSDADLQFEGSVISYTTAPIAIQSTDQAASNRLSISVKVKYSNRFDEKKNFEETFTRFADFPSSKSLASVETQLTEEVNKQLVQDIFNKAFNNW